MGRDTEIFGNYKIAAKLAHINDILDDVTESTGVYEFAQPSFFLTLTPTLPHRYSQSMKFRLQYTADNHVSHLLLCSRRS